MNQLSGLFLLLAALALSPPTAGAGEKKTAPTLDIARIFRAVDTDANQRIGREEYQRFVSKMVEKYRATLGADRLKEFTEKRLKAFDEADPDRKGLDRKQFEELLKSGFKNIEKDRDG